MTQSITTAVFPVAGLGTRFLPVTKALPKEMLPVLDKPLIQYVVEEAVAAGIKQLVFITSHTKRAIEDYFDSNYELESRLEAKGKYRALAEIRHILPDDVSVVYVRQREPKGLGDAVLCARDVVGENPFAVLLADDLIDANGHSNCLRSMIEAYQAKQGSVLAVESVANEVTDQYGIVSLKEGESAKNRTPEIAAIVEKPAPEEAPSNLGVLGRYVLSPAIFEYLASQEQGVGGEVQLTDAIAQLLQYESVFAYAIEGRRYDCGSRKGFFEATLAFAQKDPELVKLMAS